MWNLRIKLALKIDYSRRTDDPRIKAIAGSDSARWQRACEGEKLRATVLIVRQRLSVEMGRWWAIKFKLLYTRGGHSPVSGMRWRNEMSESICSGWFDTRQAWPASSPELRGSEMWSKPMGSSLKVHRRLQESQGRSRVWEDSCSALGHCQSPERQARLDSHSGCIGGFVTRRVQQVRKWILESKIVTLWRWSMFSGND